VQRIRWPRVLIVRALGRPLGSPGIAPRVGFVKWILDPQAYEAESPLLPRKWGPLVGIDCCVRTDAVPIEWTMTVNAVGLLYMKRASRRRRSVISAA